MNMIMNVCVLITVCVCILPMSSSSDVIDLERMDSAVLGARFGGGGAKGNNNTHCFIYTRVSQIKTNCFLLHSLLQIGLAYSYVCVCV